MEDRQDGDPQDPTDDTDDGDGYEPDDAYEPDEEPEPDDDDGVEDDGGAEDDAEAEPQPAPPSDDSLPTRRPREPANIPLPGLTDDEQIALEENPSLASAVDKIVDARLQTFITANAQYVAEASKAPAFYSEYGAEVQQAIAMVPPQSRGTKAGMDTATMMAIGIRAASTGDLAAELVKAGSLLAQSVGGPAAKQNTNNKPQQRQARPASRTPSGGASTVNRQVLRERTDPLSKLDSVWGDGNGLTKAERRAIMEEVG